jgi:hypothetical protein
VHSIGGVAIVAATLGVTPPGFILDRPMLAALVPDQQYTLLADAMHPPTGRVTFRPSQLKAGVVIFENDQVKTVDEYNRLSNQDFGCQ